MFGDLDWQTRRAGLSASAELLVYSTISESETFVGHRYQCSIHSKFWGPVPRPAGSTPVVSSKRKSQNHPLSEHGADYVALRSPPLWSPIFQSCISRCRWLGSSLKHLVCALISRWRFLSRPSCVSTIGSTLRVAASYGEGAAASRQTEISRTHRASKCRGLQISATSVS